MKVDEIKGILECISTLCTENKDYLVELDQAFGDGDLGISMSEGFQEVVSWQKDIEERDIGKFLMQASKVYNEAAPSSLGTILAFFFMGMAKTTKGNEIIEDKKFAEALTSGYENIISKVNSKLGEKTILDSLIPGVNALKEELTEKNIKEAASSGEKAAKDGVEKTKDMIAVHGRAAYHGEKTVGHIDGGAYVGYLVLKGISDFYNK